MRPIADAVTEIQVQTGSTSAEYGSYLGVHINVVTKSGTNTRTARCSTSSGRRARCARTFRERSRQIRATGSSSARNSTARCSSRSSTTAEPHVLHGRLRGVRGEAITSLCVRADGPDATGELLGGLDPIRNPFTGEPYPGNIIPASQLSAVAEAQYYPEANLTGTRTTGRAEPDTDNVDQFLGASIRTSATRSG